MSQPDISITRYPTTSEIIYINGRILKDKAIMSGRQKIRDIDLLEAAVQRPQSSAFGQDAYPSLREKTAALLHSLSRNHPFKDGNKRTATVAAIFMLRVNGQCVDWGREDALQMILDLAQGGRDLYSFAGWLPLKDCPGAFEEDAERDMQLIGDIITAHHWLLTELDKQ